MKGYIPLIFYMYQNYLVSVDKRVNPIQRLTPFTRGSPHNG